MSSYKIGTVNRPANGQGNKSVTLTATVTKGTATGTKTFQMSVIELGLSDAQNVIRVAENLYLAGIEAITGNLILPTIGDNGTTITWFSDKPSIIGASGVVNRPNNGTADAVATLTATVTKGAASETKEFTCTVKQWTDAEEVLTAYESLTWSSFKGGNVSQEAVSLNLNLITVGARSAVIEWSSTNTTAVPVSGIIQRPSFAEGDVVVSLTATITVGEETMIKQFVGIKILKNLQTNAEAVATAKAALTETHILSGNSAVNNIITNLSLPRKSADESAGTVSIVWTQKKSGTQNNSSFVVLTDPSDAITLATITRPLIGGANEIVELTATISSIAANGAAATEPKIFLITIPKMTA